MAYIVSSGVTESGIILENNTMTVLDGGIANDTTVKSNGRLNVFSGGTASGTIIVQSGSMFVFDGGTACITTVSANARIDVQPGGSADKTTVLSRGRLYISNGGTATNIVWTPGVGAVQVEEGGYVTYTSEYSGVYYGSNDVLVSSAGEMNSKTVEGVISMYVYSGGVVNKTAVKVGGSMYVRNGGVANSTTVSSTGRISVSSGGLAKSTYLLEGGSMYVRNGGSASTVIVSAGSVFVSSGGVVIGVKANSGGSLYVYEGGLIDSAALNPGGQLIVSSGGTANRTTVNSGWMHVSGGGKANSTTIAEGTREVGGAIFVSSGGVADDTTIQKGGWMDVSSGGVANNTTVNASMFVYTGGTANDITVSSNGFLHAGFSSGNWFEPGGTVNDVVVSGGSMNVAYGGVANRNTVNKNGRLTIVSGGTANSTTVNSGGSLYVYSGGTANSATVSASGRMVVSSGGTVNSATINPFGKFYVSKGGAGDVIIENGGYVYVANSAKATFASNTFSGLVLSSASATVHSGTTANSITVNSKGYLEVYSGGTANNITVNAGGNMSIASGGKLTGKMTFEAGAMISMYEGAVLNFDLTQAGKEALVNDLSIIQGAPVYTLTVDGTEAEGVYTLADGAENFASTISVVSTAGEALGTLTVGETVSIGLNDYTLNLSEGALTVTVEVPDLTPTNLVGTADGVSWDGTGANLYLVELSTGDPERVFKWVADTTAQDLYELPAGTYQWRVKMYDGEEWAVGEEFESENDPGTAKVARSNADGVDDIFFASPNGTWSREYYAQHVGSLDETGWTGTGEFVSANGKGRIRNLFFGSADPSTLYLTDSENGDALFLDDVYTGLPEEIEEKTARLFRLGKIAAGAGDDIIDMTSQRFEYTGGDLFIYGGDGDDVIWANRGSRNSLFGDAGNDRIVGASGDDVIVGGIGNDSMHGGGGNDIFTFCDNWGTDTVEQLETGTVTLWFFSGSIDNWDEETKTYSDGKNSVKVFCNSADQVTLKFGSEGSQLFGKLYSIGAFTESMTKKIFDDTDKGILAGVQV